jgi:hypothetical protein
VQKGADGSLEDGSYNRSGQRRELWYTRTISLVVGRATEGGVRAMSGETCLHCDINEVVRKHIEQDDPINLPDLVAKVGESLVELILLGPEEEWGNLLAEAIRDIGQVFLERVTSCKAIRRTDGVSGSVRF